MRISHLFISIIAAHSLVALASLNAEVDESSFIVELKAENAQERSKIANIIHLDSVQDDRIVSVVNGEDLKRLEKYFLSKIISAVVFNESSVKEYESLAGIIEFPSDDLKFHTYDEMLNELRELERQYPAIAEVFSIGRSVLGKEIWGIKLNGVSTNDADEKPAMVYMGTHHAREHVSTEMPILLAKKLLLLYGSDANIRDLINSTEIYIIPMVNPDGAMHDIEGQRYKMWRKNRRQNSSKSYGVDLNRNYGFGWGTGGSSTNPSSDVYMGPSPFSEPETKAIRDFFLAHRNAKIALSFHTFSELILYPWGGKDEGVGGADERLFKKMASDMAVMNNYRPMQSSELYIASGDTCDWLYGELKVYCFTFELSPSSMWEGGFYPGQSIIDRVFDDNWNPMLYLANLADNPSLALSY